MEGSLGIVESILPQLGISAIFLYVAYKLYMDSNSKILEKDQYIRSLHASLQELYVKNAELLSQLRDTITAHTRSIEANTEAIKDLKYKIE